MRRKKLTIVEVIAQNGAHGSTALREHFAAGECAAVSRHGLSPGHVRIIGGRWRGTRLPVADRPGLRPSSNRVRETLFNWLQPKLHDARVLDLYAGSGALGLEALSRGAREAFLVERDATLAEQLRLTVQRLHAEGEAHVLRADALSLLQLPVHGRFDIVFVDPPFDAKLWRATLALLAPWLAEDAWLYLEMPLAADEPLLDGAWVAHRHGHTRDVRYALFRRVREATATLAGADDAATEWPG